MKNNSTIQKMIKSATSKDIDLYIPLDLEDINSILEEEGLVSTLSSSGRGDNVHKESLQALVDNYKDCKSIKTILICFTIHETFSIMEINLAVEEICKVFIGDEDIIYSVYIDNKLAVDEVQPVIIILN